MIRSTLYSKLIIIRRDIPTVSNRLSRVICPLVIVVVSCTEMMCFLSFGPWQICITFVCFGTALYIRKLSLNYVFRRKMFCRCSCLALILVKVSGVFLLTDVFIMF